MSLHFVLDGYNIIRRTPKLDCDNLRQSRQNLVDFIIRYQPQGSLKNRLTIVFDGKSDIIYHKDTSSVELIFSEDESADDLIRKIIAKSSNKKNICLVSDDKGLASSVKDVGVKVYSVLDFLSKVNPKPLKDKKQNIENKSTLGYSQIQDINKELSRLWLEN